MKYFRLQAKIRDGTFLIVGPNLTNSAEIILLGVNEEWLGIWMWGQTARYSKLQLL